MGHFKGIGPTKYGTSDKSSNSQPCGTPKISPLDATAAQNAAFGPGSKLADKNPEQAAKILDGINEADSGANFGTPLNSQMPGIGVGMGSMVKGIGSLATDFGRVSAKKRQLARNRGGAVDSMIPANPGPASPGGGSAGMQADLEGLHTKLADLKSQIDNLANTV